MDWIQKIVQKNTKSSTSKTAFVLGNGRSRLAIDPWELKQHGTLFGCNAAYRDCPLDYLVAVDVFMIDEIITTQVHKDIPFYIDDRHSAVIDPQVHKIETRYPGKMDSGTLALLLTQQLGFLDVYMIGFDYISSNKYHNNVYADTNNYKRTTDQHVLEVTKESWYQRQMILLNRFPDTLFTRVNGNDFEPPFEADNFASIHIDTFIDKYQLTRQEIPEQVPRILTQKIKQPKNQGAPPPPKTNEYNPGANHPVWYKP